MRERNALGKRPLGTGRSGMEPARTLPFLTGAGSSREAHAPAQGRHAPSRDRLPMNTDEVPAVFGALSWDTGHTSWWEKGMPNPCHGGASNRKREAPSFPHQRDVWYNCPPASSSLAILAAEGRTPGAGAGAGQPFLPSLDIHIISCYSPRLPSEARVKHGHTHCTDGQTEASTLGESCKHAHFSFQRPAGLS